MEMISAADVLRAAREKVGDQKCWVQGMLAGNEDGFEYPTNPLATRWCADGAVLAIQHVMDATPAKLTGNTPGFWLTQAAIALGFPTASTLNDATGTKHEDVLSMFDLAIRMAESDRGVPS